MDKIKETTKKVLLKSTVSPSLVKQALIDFDLVKIENNLVMPTPIVKRFAFVNDSMGES